MTDYSLEAEGRKRPSGGLFGDINKLRDAEETDEDADERERAKFHEHTICGRIARSKYFEYITLGVICFNALYLGYDCDYNARWGKPEMLYESPLYGFMIFDNLFCMFFSFEVVVRFVGYVYKTTMFTDKPFLFDLFLVTLMVVETWVLAFLGPIDALKQVSILRLLRLTRLFRMAKLMRYFPELQLIVKGMLAAVRSVGCATILLLLVLYVFAIIFTNEYHQGHIADDDEDIPEISMLFGSLGKSMRHLLIMATILDDITYCTNTIRGTDKIQMLFFFFGCVLVSSFTLFNMLLGILCEVVEATEAGEKEKMEQEKLSGTITGFFRTMDVDQNGTISRNEFLKMSQHEEIMDALSKLEINGQEFEKYAELLFTPKEEGGPLPTLNYNDAVAMIMRLRPGQSVNACDLEYFRTGILTGNRQIDGLLSSLESLLEEAAGMDEDEPDITTSVSPFSPHDDDLSPNSPNSADNSNERSNVRRASIESGDNRAAGGNTRNVPIGNTTGATRQVSPGAGGKVSEKEAAKAKQRSMPTIRSLAHSHKADAGKVPPVASRWAAPEQPPPISPRSPGNRGTSEEVVAARLQNLAEKRQALSSSLRASMGQTSPGAGMVVSNYFMSQSATNFRSPKNYQSNYLEDADDNEAPFSPNGFSFSGGQTC